ncbi:MAG: hypothetical protein CMO64_07940 [Verrucomicrobiales bacterium]|nr:hypothetical protein [Verrucomicrobiales bacterium]
MKTVTSILKSLLAWGLPLLAGWWVVAHYGITFRQPGWLAGLAVLPVAAFLLGRRGQPAALVYSSIALVRRLTRAAPSRAGAVLNALRWLALALFLTAMARPQTELGESRKEHSGIDIMLAVDLSDSMLAEDIPPNRLDATKKVMAEFIGNRPNDRLGLAVFSGKVYVGSLTMDHEFLQHSLRQLTVDTFIRDEEGTAIGSGLMSAINKLRDQKKAKSRIVILMTDGMSNTGKIPALTAAEVARTMDVKVYTIGVGKKGTNRLPRRGPGGQVFYVPLNVEIDEETLQKIASTTGGRYFRAEDKDTLGRIYQEINKAEPTEHKPRRFKVYRDHFSVLILAGLLLLLLEVVLSQTILKRVP